MKTESRAIVLKKTAYGDADWIVNLFTRDRGRIGAFAKSARASKRRFSGAFEAGTLLDVRLSETKEGALARLDGVEVIRPVIGVMRSLDRVNALMRAVELAMSFLQEREEAKEKFDVLDEYITTLNSKEPSSQDILAFEFNWLRLSGFAPSFSSCILCKKNVGSAGHFVFDIDHAGLLCSGCARKGRAKIHLSPAALRGLASLSALRDVPDVASARAAWKVLSCYVNYVVGRPLRTEAGI